MKPDKIFLSLAFVIILTTISWITSCTHKTDISNIPEICFKDVNTIIRTQLFYAIISGCHDGSGESFPLLTYQDIHNAVVPHNADNSPLYKAIISVRGENKMPPDKPISRGKQVNNKILD